MWRLCQASTLAGSLLLTGAAKESKRAAYHAGTSALADQFILLAFGADPGSLTPRRERLAHFRDDMRIYVSGSDAGRAAAGSAAAEIARATKLPISTVTDGQPNVFVAVTSTPAETFAGPLRQLLDLALSNDESDVEAFIASVVSSQRCWILPVWGDVQQATIKSAVIGVDQRMAEIDIGRCIFRKLAAALGLLGPEGSLPHSLFNPHSGATRPSREDLLILRLISDPALPADLNEDEAADAIPAALQRLRAK